MVGPEAAARGAGDRRAVRTAAGLAVGAVAMALASLVLAAVNGISPVELVGLHLGVGTLTAMTSPVLGALIVARQPRNWFGWVLVVQGAFLGVFVLAQQYAPLALGLTRPGVSLPGALVAAWLAAWTMMPGIVLGSTLTVLLFPDGGVPSPRWRPVAWASLLATVLPTAILAVLNWPLRGPDLARQGFVATTPETDAVFGLGFLAAQALLVVSVVGLLLRFRRAAGLQRQQIKWFVYGGIVTVPLSLSVEVEGIGPVLELLSVPVLTGAIAIAMFRYKLYDIDRLYNRTLVYGLLTASLGGIYALGVLGVGQVLSSGREPSSLTVAASTLAVAAAFQPLRRSIQTAVDRRFNRHRYDATLTIDRFASRLRQQVDLDALTTELLAVAKETMEPTTVSVWLREPDRAVGERRPVP